MFKSFIFYSNFIRYGYTKAKVNEARRKIAEFEAKGQIKEKYQYLHEINRCNWTQGYVDLLVLIYMWKVLKMFLKMNLFYLLVITKGTSIYYFY